MEQNEQIPEAVLLAQTPAGEAAAVSQFIENAMQLAIALLPSASPEQKRVIQGGLLRLFQLNLAVAETVFFPQLEEENREALPEPTAPASGTKH